MTPHTTVTLPSVHFQLIVEVLDVRVRASEQQAEQYHALALSAEGEEQLELLEHAEAMRLIARLCEQIRDEIRRAIG